MSIDIHLKGRPFSDNPITFYETGMVDEHVRFQADFISGPLGTPVPVWAPTLGGKSGSPDLTTDDVQAAPQLRQRDGHGAVSFSKSGMTMTTGSGPATMERFHRTAMIVASVGVGATLGEQEQFVQFDNTAQTEQNYRDGVLGWNVNGNLYFKPWGNAPLVISTATFQPGDPFCAILTIDSNGTPAMNVNGAHIAGTGTVDYTGFDRFVLGYGTERFLTGAIYEVTTGRTALTPAQMMTTWTNVRNHYAFL